VAAQGQKVLANWSRGVLKDLLPEVKDALDIQSEVYTLRSVLNKARSTAETQGSKIRMGGVDLTKPGTWLSSILQNEKIASKFLNGSQITAGVNPNSAILNSVSGKIGADTVNQDNNAPLDTSVQTPQDQLTQDTVAPIEQTNTPTQDLTQKKPTNVFGGLTKQEVVAKALQSQLNYQQIQQVIKIYDELVPAQKPPSAAAQKEIIKANSAVRALNRLGNELIGTNGDLSKVWKSKLPLAPGAQTYRADWGSVVDAIGSFRTGAAYTKEQRADYSYMLPQVSDSPQIIKEKLKAIREELQGYAGMMQNTSNEGMQLNQ
jgi:hypothetical protein